MLSLAFCQMKASFSGDSRYFQKKIKRLPLDLVGVSNIHPELLFLVLVNHPKINKKQTRHHDYSWIDGESTQYRDQISS